jgi:tetraacyldisaccharide 4'-kinase
VQRTRSAERWKKHAAPLKRCSVMRQPDFWWRNTIATPVGAAALSALGFFHGASVAWKHRLRSPYRAGIPVICVGNLTVGGTGKTPVAIALAHVLQMHAISPAFLLRGYGRRTAETLVVNTELHDASTVGDEALLLARIAPTIVSIDRAAGARIAEARGARVLIMDDGHQNFSLRKDLSLVVVDGERGFGNGRIVPAGPLREPVQQGLRRADAVVVMGGGNPALAGFAGPLLRARLAAARWLDGRRVVAFAGIGFPEKFLSSLRKAGADVVEAHAFADHHAYTAVEIARLKTCAAEAHATLITTEKDFVRLDRNDREGIEVLPVRAIFDDPTALELLLDPLVASVPAVP